MREWGFQVHKSICLNSFNSLTPYEAQVAQSLHVRADIASDILMHAKILFEEQEKKKQEERMSLGLPGTTKEKAARYKLNSDLASAALEVASSEEETFSTEN